MKRINHNWLAAALFVTFFGIGYVAPDLFSSRNLDPMATITTPTVSPTSQVAISATHTSSPVAAHPPTATFSPAPSPSVVASPTSLSTTTPTTEPHTPTPEPSATATVQPSPTPTAAETIHVVTEGDTISDIAQRYGVTIRAILDANGLSDDDTLSPGQQLKIPGSGRQTYVVQEGDTLLAIANRFGISADALAQANGLQDQDALQVGQELVIPAH